MPKRTLRSGKEYSYKRGKSQEKSDSEEPSSSEGPPNLSVEPSTSSTKARKRLKKGTSSKTGEVGVNEVSSSRVENVDDDDDESSTPTPSGDESSTPTPSDTSNPGSNALNPGSNALEGFEPMEEEDYGEAPLLERAIPLVAAENQDPAAENQDPAAENQEPAAENQEPAAENQEPAAENQEPAAENQEEPREQGLIEMVFEIMQGDPMAAPEENGHGPGEENFARPPPVNEQELARIAAQSGTITTLFILSYLLIVALVLFWAFSYFRARNAPIQQPPQ